MDPLPRTVPQRRQDTLDRLAHDVDCWVASADPGSGTPYLIPLSFRWDGSTLLMATPEKSPTSRNLQATRTVRIGLGPTRDVVLVDGTVEPLDEVPDEVGDAFAAATGFDPRGLRTRYRYFRIHPVRIQAWREANELAGRDVMRDGRWVG